MSRCSLPIPNCTVTWHTAFIADAEREQRGTCCSALWEFRGLGAGGPTESNVCIFGHITSARRPHFTGRVCGLCRLDTDNLAFSENTTPTARARISLCGPADGVFSSTRVSKCHNEPHGGFNSSTSGAFTPKPAVPINSSALGSGDKVRAFPSEYISRYPAGSRLFPPPDGTRIYRKIALCPQ